MTGSDHPFFDTLKDLSNEELEKKQNEILNRWRIARSMNMHPDVMHQIDLMLNTIEEEKYKRQSLDDQPNGSILETDPIVLQKFDPNKIG